MEKTPQISVIMPVYNAAPYLAEAIESVLSQTFTDFEFLIHDDGSTDGSADILHTYAAQDARIILSTGANKGVSAARNILQNKARGEFFAVMDADDICLPDRFEKQVAYLDAHPDCVVLGARELTIDHKGRPIIALNIPLTHEEIDSYNLRGLTSIRHPTAMMRRSAVLKCGGYDESYKAAGDQELWLRMGEIGRLANLPDVVLKYRVHDSSISGSKPDLQRQMCRQACEAAWARRGLSNTRFDYNNWRMADTPASRCEFYLRYGWQARNSGYNATARHYFIKALKLSPFSQDVWKGIIFGILRHKKETR